MIEKKKGDIVINIDSLFKTKELTLNINGEDVAKYDVQSIVKDALIKAISQSELTCKK